MVVNELHGRQIANGAVRPLFIVFPSPGMFSSGPHYSTVGLPRQWCTPQGEGQYLVHMYSANRVGWASSCLSFALGEYT